MSLKNSHVSRFRVSPVTPSLLFWKFLVPLRAAEQPQHKSTRAGSEIEDTGASVKPGVAPEGKVILTQPFFCILGVEAVSFRGCLREK